MSNGNQPIRPTRKLTGGLINSSLLVANPTQTGMNLNTATQNMSGMFLNLSVNDIDFFDKNPRRQHDEELYGQIKASIRASGVQHPVHVTRRPDSGKYILAQGGNTRLKIVKELYEETGDARFASIPCIYIEYTNDEDIQIAHLIENEQRADMVFWDKACAYAEIRDMLQEKSAETLGLRKLVDAFSSYGLSISFSKLSLFFFATDNLSALGKFCNDLSLSKTTEIRKQYNELLGQLAFEHETGTAFADFWESTLDRWHSEHIEETELDVPALQVYLQQQFEAVYGIKQETGTTSPNGYGAASAAVTGTASDSEPQEKAETTATPDVQSDSVARNAVEPHSEAFIRETETSNRPLPQSAAESPTSVSAHNPVTLPSAAAAVALDENQAIKALHTAVINLTNAANIRDFLIFDDKMPYGYMLDLPDFSSDEWRGNLLINGSLNIRHPRASVVFGYLWQTSNESELFGSPDMLQKYNPFLANERRHPVLAAAYRDPELFKDVVEYTLGAGGFDNLNLNVYYLMTGDEELSPLLFEYLQAVINAHYCGWPKMDVFKPV